MSEMKSYIVRQDEEEGCQDEVYAVTPLEAAASFVREVVTNWRFHHGEDCEIPDDMKVIVEETFTEKACGVYNMPVALATQSYTESLLIKEELDKTVELSNRKSDELDQLVQLAEKAREDFDIEIGQCNPFVVFEELIAMFNQNIDNTHKIVVKGIEADDKIRKLETIIEYLEGKLAN